MHSQPAHCLTDAITYSSLSKGSLVVARPNNVVAESFSAEDPVPESKVLLKFQPQAIGCLRGEGTIFDVFCFSNFKRGFPVQPRARTK